MLLFALLLTVEDIDIFVWAEDSFVHC